MIVTPFSVAARFVGLTEIPGHAAHPVIMSMLTLDSEWPEDDSVPWCSAFVNYIFWILGLQRSKSLMARSWLEVGFPVPMAEATPGYDLVVMKRGGPGQPGPSVIDAPGHVAFYHSHTPPDLMNSGYVRVLGGNQRDQVSFEDYRLDRVLGVRRIILEDRNASEEENQ